MKRMVRQVTLKPDCVQQYIDYHQDVWTELEQAYRDAGFKVIRCFLCGNVLIVYSEYDETIYAAAEAKLAQNPYELKWKDIMDPLMDPSVPAKEFEEVYVME